MKKIDWTRLFNCALFAALIIMCMLLISILIGSVIHLIGIYGCEWSVLIGIILLLFIRLTYHAYKNNITY